MKRLLLPLLVGALVLALGCGDGKGKVIAPKDVPPGPAPGALPKGGEGGKAPGETAPPPPKL